MKKLLTICILLVAVSFTGKAQQVPLYSQYMMNGFLINPAMAGSYGYIPIRLTFRDQWEGISKAPRTAALSANAALGVNKQYGVGGYIYSDWFGPIGRTGFMGAFAYHIKFAGLEDTKLALGLSVSAFQYVVDETQFNMLEEDDPNVVSGAKETAWAPDANFGAYFYNPKFFIGFSLNQLIPISVGINDDNQNKMDRHYFLTGGYKFKLGEKFDLEPSILFKATEKSPVQFDINVKGYLLKNYYLGLSYRTGGNALVALLGVKYKMVYIGYAFDYTFSDIQTYATAGSHEFMLGVNIGEGKSSGSTLF